MLCTGTTLPGGLGMPGQQMVNGDYDNFEDRYRKVGQHLYLHMYLDDLIKTCFCQCVHPLPTFIYLFVGKRNNTIFLSMTPTYCCTFPLCNMSVSHVYEVSLSLKCVFMYMYHLFSLSWNVSSLEKLHFHDVLSLQTWEFCRYINTGALV